MRPIRPTVTMKPPSKIGSKFSETSFPRMADTQEKVDPIGARYFRPLTIADLAADVLFYVSAALSLVVPLIEQPAYPKLYSVTQIAFAISVIAMFVSLAIRLYFAPRAQVRR